MAFSPESKRIIRDNHDNEPHGSGYDFGYTECSHIDHTKDFEYDDPDNAKLYNLAQHYIEHALAARGDIDNGLPRHVNQWAANMIWKRSPEEVREYIYYVAQME